VTSEVVDSITFPCVHCLAELQIPAGAWDGWVRCRSCERLFLPPDFEGLRQISRRSAVPGSDTGLPLAAGSPNGAAGFTLSQPVSGRMAHTNPARLVFITGFVLCLLLTLIKFLDFSPGGMTIFGFFTLAFFLLLMRTPSKRLPPAGKTWGRQAVEATTQDDSSPNPNS
jgi:hypothetical protein